MERIWHHNKPAKRGPPTKTHRPGKEGINQRGNKRPKITLNELQSSTAEIGVSVYRTTLSHTLHRAGLYGREAIKKQLLKEKNKQTHLGFANRHVGDSPKNMEESTLVRWDKNVALWPSRKTRWWGENPTPLITRRPPSPQWSMVVAASCYGGVFHRQGLGNWSDLKEWWMVQNRGTFLRETCFWDLRLEVHLPAGQCP